MNLNARNCSVEENTRTDSLALSSPHLSTRGIHITIHGHFYQPPRENPYVNIIERQPSAYPFHDWNERIHYECYRPNAFARIFNDRGEIVRIVNNFAYMSFNIGATLMSWLEKHDFEVYQRIIQADRQSCNRLAGHGNAIAQVYNHIILPLANQRDKYTQIRWGKADFSSRFGRQPEGMWLAETAVDYATVQALIDEQIKFIILAPSQAQRCRPLPTEENPESKWLEVGGSQIDPTRPYRCFIEDGRYLDIFFYDGPISRDMGFSDVLTSTDTLVQRLSKAIRGDNRQAQLINVATDGETFGHHKKDKERCLAYAFVAEFPKRHWQVTNYAHYLSLYPPTWQVELKPVTAWSCAHGVDRWQADCGCGGGGEWQQKWRKPLRQALDWLRDQLITVYETRGKELFHAPWLARDEYIHVILNRQPDNVTEFFLRHQSHPLSEIEKIDSLRLLEMQRHALLMYTSCGWFFEEISRPEGVQILRYANRAIKLAGDVAGIELETEFIQRLAQAPSNLDNVGDGSKVYQNLVKAAQVDFQQVTAQYAISSLFTTYAKQETIYCYDIEQIDYSKQQIGSLALAIGHIKLTSQITWESHNEFVFAVLHLGDQNFHCCLQNFAGRLAYTQLKEKLFTSLNQASTPGLIVAMTEIFGGSYFNLQDLLAEERYRLMEQLTQKTKLRLDQLYNQVYRDNYGILIAFQQEQIPVPQELQVAAEISLAHSCNQILQTLTPQEAIEITLEKLDQLNCIAIEANHLRCQLKLPQADKLMASLIRHHIWQICYGERLNNSDLAPHLAVIKKILGVSQQLNLVLSLEREQELYYQCLHSQIIPHCWQLGKIEQTEAVNPKANSSKHQNNTCRWNLAQIPLILELGTNLGVSTKDWKKRINTRDNL
ncbi:MAG: DUF3536 domain-containing protein [Cyanobacteria bacterium J083]|nr:MAG: DUF3536 domain-containing protein [Cyanobacteria bacterium J083]